MHHEAWKTDTLDPFLVQTDRKARTHNIVLQNAHRRSRAGDEHTDLKIKFQEKGENKGKKMSYLPQLRLSSYSTPTGHEKEQKISHCKVNSEILIITIYIMHTPIEF